MKRYVFPYEDIKDGSRIIIYGSGDIGRQYISQIKSYSLQKKYNVEVIFVVDGSGYFLSAKLHDVNVFEPGMIQNTNPNDYDYILIAEENENGALSIKNYLLDLGVPADKIVYSLISYEDIAYLYNPEIKKWFMPTFSHFGEDIIVKELFWQMGIENPSYLDIGCNHPYKGNNTALLYMTGSRGINIDANLNCIELMEKERTDDQNIVCGVMPEEGEKDFFILSEMSSLNSFSEDYIKFYFDTYLHNAKAEKNVRKVKCYTLNGIIKKFCDGVFPDFLDLDIEGMDEAVIASYDFSNNGPKVICVETHSTEVTRQLISQGYEYRFSTRHNTIYSRSDFSSEIDICLKEVIPEIRNILDNSDSLKLVIYGVGFVGRHVFEKICCGKECIPIEGFMVESMEGNPNYWMGKEVKEIGSFDPKSSVVLVALAAHNQTGVEEKLRNMGYKHIIMIDENSNKLQ